MKNMKSETTSYHVVPACDETSSDLFDTDTVDGGVITNYAEFDKVYMFGEKTTGFKITGPPQNYLKLRRSHVQNKTLFSDENFAPKNIAMTKIKGEVVWKRPFEIVENPQFIIDGATRFDIDQGQLGDCWFLAATANLTTNEKLFCMVVPNDQNFSQDYAGIFHFRFWQYGRWVDVVIDDRLPTVDNELVYLRSSDRREFWPSLLEKAYAKFYGSYKNIEGGQITEALEDLCGGLSEFYSASHEQIYEIMYVSYQRSSFMGCSIVSPELEGRRSDGLITTHAYSVTGMKPIRVGDSDIRLIRVRNPWGNDAEWNGDWSDNSDSWNLLPKELKNQLLTKRADGEFWIEAADFQRCFTFVDICHLNPSSFLYSDGDDKNWVVNMFEGSWVPNVTAGGGRKFMDTFSNNPQYHLTIRGDKDKSSSSYAVVIGLLQKDRRALCENELPLEINIYRVKTRAGQLLDSSFFESTAPVVQRAEVGTRQLTVRVMLPVGRYCIVPSTGYPNVYASYLLRIYSEVTANIIENDDEVGYSSNAILNVAKDNQFTNKSLFQQVAGDKSEIGWYGVKKALNKQFGTRRIFCFTKPKFSFSKDTCQNIVALWDADYSGRLDDEEFENLMQDVASLRAIFKKFDADNSGKLDGFELRNLLTACGYKVNRQILVIIMLRYGFNGSMNFENFVVCAFKLKTMIDEFHRRKTIDTSDQINVNRRDWLQTTLYS
ncbi:hypothetical protein Zmor_006745 [Zophobas morio]|uniref:Calpain-A n=1 Tax=Zophobas morio TaxID=2755281 RepID=A0AA38MNI5_9CUCU|nr:hypothetical protein Zmor_006745 [Zophobas morio]